MKSHIYISYFCLPFFLALSLSLLFFLLKCAVRSFLRSDSGNSIVQSGAQANSPFGNTRYREEKLRGFFGYPQSPFSSIKGCTMVSCVSANRILATIKMYALHVLSEREK